MLGNDMMSVSIVGIGKGICFCFGVHPGKVPVLKHQKRVLESKCLLMQDMQDFQPAPFSENINYRLIGIISY